MFAWNSKELTKQSVENFFRNFLKKNKIYKKKSEARKSWRNLQEKVVSQKSWKDLWSGFGRNFWNIFRSNHRRHSREYHCRNVWIPCRIATEILGNSFGNLYFVLENIWSKIWQNFCRNHLRNSLRNQSRNSCKTLWKNL